MTAPTRVAGWGRLADGSVVTWTVSAGRRGRRWREVIARGTDTVHALLLETDPDGRFGHLELARADGLWTFHPEGDGTLHGNHVRAGEPDVRHVVGWPFAPDDVLLVEGSPVSGAAIAWRRRSSQPEGAVEDAAGVAIGPGGALERRSQMRIERSSRTRWRIGEGSPFEIDEAGLPLLDGGASHPLELA